VNAVDSALDEQRLRDALADEPFIRRLVRLETADSTNDVARDLAHRGAPEGTVVIAEQQTAGRGRLGRTWHSPRGYGLYVSVLYRPREPILRLTRWTLGAAVAACTACRRLGGAAVTLDWPNDLMLGRLKLGGVLAELRSQGGLASDLVLGCGINVGQRAGDFPHELSSTATSLRMAGGEVPQREVLAAIYLRELAAIHRDLSRGEWETVARRWERLAPDARGAVVRVSAKEGGTSVYEGTTCGLDEMGALRVRRADGRVMAVRQAESVLPLGG